MVETGFHMYVFHIKLISLFMLKPNRWEVYMQFKYMHPIFRPKCVFVSVWILYFKTTNTSKCLLLWGEVLVLSSFSGVFFLSGCQLSPEVSVSLFQGQCCVTMTEGRCRHCRKWSASLGLWIRRVVSQSLGGIECFLGRPYPSMTTFSRNRLENITDSSVE